MAVFLLGALAVAASSHGSAQATPTGAPYPLLEYFTEIDATPYAQSDPPGATLPDQPGYWFTTAQGLSCGIWFRGSFGCSGAAIPGAPPGIQKIGYITGDTRVHYDWTLALRFPPPRGSIGIPPLNYIRVEGTTCGTTLDGSTYCERGASRFLITADRTWLNG